MQMIKFDKNITEFLCTKCGKDMSKKIKSYKFKGQYLCYDCVENIKCIDELNKMKASWDWLDKHQTHWKDWE